MHEGEVILALVFPTNQQAPEPVVPRVGPFHNPAARLAAGAARGRGLALPASVRRDASGAEGGFSVRVVVPLVETEMGWASWPAGRPDHHVVEHLADQPLVVDVRAGHTRSDGHAPAIGQNVPCDTGFRPIGRIGTGLVPPCGAFTMALANAVHVHGMPRRAS